MALKIPDYCLRVAGGVKGSKRRHTSSYNKEPFKRDQSMAELLPESVPLEIASGKGTCQV